MTKGTFIKRLNRFIAEVRIEDQIYQVHVKNTGRCEELFIPGATVYLEPSTNDKRKTPYSLITIEKGRRMINIDSQVPNRVVEEAFQQSPHLKDIFGEHVRIRREVTYGSSRFDLYYESEDTGRKGFIEIKGVTLEVNDVAMFPDAPTVRGSKHVMELMKAQQEGYNNYILFLIQMKGVHQFRPYEENDPIFATHLRQAKDSGVGVLVFDSMVSSDCITFGEPVPLIL